MLARGMEGAQQAVNSTRQGKTPGGGYGDALGPSSYINSGAKSLTHENAPVWSGRGHRLGQALPQASGVSVCLVLVLPTRFGSDIMNKY